MQRYKLLSTIFILLCMLQINSTAQEAYSLFSENQLLGLKNQQGQIVVPAKYISINDIAKANEKISDYKGLFTAKQTGKDGAIKGGIINTKGETVLPFNYRYITPFSDDLAIAVAEKQLDIVDVSGRIINTIKYSAKEAVVKGFNHGIAVAYGFYNSGKITVFNKEKIINTFKTKTNFDLKILSPKLITLRDGHKGYNQYYSLFNINGERLTEEMYNYIDSPNKQGLMFASKGWNSAATYGYLNDNGKEVIPFVYGIDLTQMNVDGIFSAGGSLYNSRNEIVKKANKDTTYYMHLPNSSYLLYFVRTSYGAGLINQNLRIITPILFLYKHLSATPNQKIVYNINNKRFEISENGKITPDNGSLEYENAMATIPKNATHELDWKLPNTYLQLAIAKNYKPAEKILDSLYSDANYIKLNPNTKHLYNANLEKNALAGNVNSMYELGRAYIIGEKPFSQNPEKGIQWLQQAANKNHVEAAYDLVYYYIREHDENKAQQALNNYKGEKPYKMQDLYAPGGLQLALARFSANNDQLQNEFYTKAINMGNIEAARNYGNKLIFSKNANEIAKGLNILHNNIAKGDINSMMTLGEYYGISAKDKTRVDVKKSNDYYKMALSNSKINAYQKVQAAAAIDNNLGIDRSLVTCTNCKGAGKITWDKPITYNKWHDKNGKVTFFGGKETTTVKSTDNCPVCNGTGKVKQKK